MSDTEIEATVDLRGVDAGPLSEWRELVSRGLVKRDADLVLVADVARMIETARAAERELCAKVCEARHMGDNNREDMEAMACASAIRALK